MRENQYAKDERICNNLHSTTLQAARQCAETLALQLDYLKPPGIALGVLIQRIAEICEEQIEKVKTTRETHAASMEKQRQDNAMNEIKLEDEYEYIITLMQQDSSVETLREKLPQALEALDKIKNEYRRFYDESMEETRSFDSGMRSLLYGIDQVICKRLDLGTDPAKAPTPADEEEAQEEPAEEEGEEADEEEDAPIVYDDEEQTVGEEYDYITLKNDRRLYVQDNKHPEHAHDLVGILTIPHKLEAEIEEEKRLAEEAAAEAADIAAANGGAEEPEPEAEEEEEDGEKKEKFVANAMVSPENPFSAWGNEPLLEVLEIPVR